MVYSGPRLARAYAFDRPTVHAQVLEYVAIPQVDWALDLGCGAGLSTLALLPYARRVVGLERSLAMLSFRRPGVDYVAGRIEQIPFHDNSFPLVSAAGSINYAPLDIAMAEIRRVLMPGGTFVLYDIGAGYAPKLMPWWAEFDSRFPESPGYEVERLDFMSYVDVRVTQEMTLEGFVRYVLSEVGVEEAIQRGESLASIQGWCHTSLAPLFGKVPMEIYFDGYVAVYQSHERQRSMRRGNSIGPRE